MSSILFQILFCSFNQTQQKHLLLLSSVYLDVGFFGFFCKGKIAGKIHKTQLDAATSKQTDDDNQNSWNPNPKNKIPECISFLFFSFATCSERKINRIVKKNCKYQQGVLHPKTFFQQFCNDSLVSCFRKNALFCRRHYALMYWKPVGSTSVRKCNWNSAGSQRGRVLEKGSVGGGARPAPSGYQSGYPARPPCWSKIKYTRLRAKSSTGYDI